jgi:type VI secretion system protein ImpA
LADLEALLAQVEDSPPCGPNLEHDLSFFEFEEAARPKPEQQIGDAIKPAEDPKWPKVVELGEGLLRRTKDLRVAVNLTRALAHTEGLPGLADGLSLIHGLLERYWDQVHPLLEADNNDDPTERLNALTPLADPETVIKDLRDTEVANSREHGQLQAREIEIALGRLAPTGGGGMPKSLSQIHTQIAGVFAQDRTVPTKLHEAHDRVMALQALMAERVGSDRAVDLKPLAQPLESLIEAFDAALGVRTAAAGAAAEEAPNGLGVALDGQIRSREAAVHVLSLVCDYLERHEPSNPAPLFIRRAQRLMTKNFVEIVKELLPDSLGNLERLAGEIESKPE